MATTVLLFLLLLPLPLLSAAASDAHILLTTIKPALSGTIPNLELTSWNLSLPLCQWRGLTWTSSATFPTPIPCSSPPFRSNLSLISDHSLALLSLHLPAANLSGHLPPELSLLPSLRSLLLPLNSLSGPLPLDLFNSPSLQQLDLSSNRLSGALPVSFWNVCPTIITIRFNSNSIYGPIPSPALPDSPCPSLTLLDLSSNRLTGAIPSLLFASALSDLDISDNSLSGQVPESLIKLKNLTTLDVSHNNLTGQTPQGSARFGAEAFSGNALCGAPLAPCAGAGAGSTGPSPGVIAGIVIGLMAGAVVAASLSIGWVQGRRRRRLREDGMEVDEEGESEEGKLVVFQGGEHLNLEDVLNATGEVMDKTSYGTVYKAKLADGGTIALRLLRDRVPVDHIENSSAPPMAEAQERRRESSTAAPTHGSYETEAHTTDPDLLSLLLARHTTDPDLLSLLLARPTVKQKVASFVDKVEKAHLYFELIEFLTEKENWKIIAPIPPGFAYAQIIQLTNKFDALPRSDVRAALHVCHASRLKRPRISKGEVAKCLLLEQLEEDNPRAFSSPTFRAVFLSRNEVYDMDPCPEEELKKKHDFLDYSMDHFTYNEPAAMWWEKNEKSVSFVATKYGEACTKYGELLSRKAQDVRVDREAENHVVIDNAPKELEMPVRKQKREGGDGSTVSSYSMKKMKDYHKFQEKNEKSASSLQPSMKKHVLSTGSSYQ